ncbi:unnamed protein product [Rhodiola kirilowii]
MADEGKRQKKPTDDNGARWKKISSHCVGHQLDSRHVRLKATDG